MRILITTRLQLYKADAPSECALNLNKEFRKMGHDVTLHVPLTDVSSHIDNRIYDIGLLEGNKYVKSIQKLETFDLHIINGLWAPWSLKTLFFTLGCKTKTVMIPHGQLNSVSVNRSIKKRFALLIFSTILKSLDKIIFFNSSDLKNSFIRFSNYKIIPNGVSHRNIDFDELNTSLPIKLLYIGRIELIQKGFDRMFKFIKQLNDIGGIQVSLTIYGQDSRRNNIFDLEKMCSHYGIGRLVNINGPIYGADKEYVLSSHDGFMLLSRGEGMPLAALEAMRFGLVPILSYETNLLEDSVIKDSAVIFNDSVENMVTEFIARYKSGLIKKNMTLAQHVKKNYSWTSVAQRYIIL